MITGANVDGVWVVEYDTDKGTYTTRDRTGRTLEQRPLTAEETSEMASAEADGQARDVLRAAAVGTGAFSSAAVRDAAIRACARAILGRG